MHFFDNLPIKEWCIVTWNIILPLIIVVPRVAQLFRKINFCQKKKLLSLPKLYGRVYIKLNSDHTIQYQYSYLQAKSFNALARAPILHSALYKFVLFITIFTILSIYSTPHQNKCFCRNFCCS